MKVVSCYQTLVPLASVRNSGMLHPQLTERNSLTIPDCSMLRKSACVVAMETMHLHMNSISVYLFQETVWPNWRALIVEEFIYSI